MPHPLCPVVGITGASRGLGLGLACLLAAQRVPLVLTARSPLPLDSVARTLRAAGAVVQTRVADAADDRAMSDAFDAASRLGPLGALVNNAGVLEPIGPVAELDLHAFESALRTNVIGVLVGTRLALAHRSPDATLRIVNVSSGAATHPYAGWAAYCSSKAAVSMLTRVTAVENPDAIAVSVAPGIIETRMQRVIRSTPPARFPAVDRFVSLHESGNLSHPLDAAVTLDWLARSAPRSMSGELVDALGDPMRATLDAVRATAPMVAAIAQARAWFDALEPGASGR